MYIDVAKPTKRKPEVKDSRPCCIVRALCNKKKSKITTIVTPNNKEKFMASYSKILSEYLGSLQQKPTKKAPKASSKEKDTSAKKKTTEKSSSKSEKPAAKNKNDKSKKTATKSSAMEIDS